ncbi:L-methionine (R)-S-oxide reductase [Catalinimonas alkaloidigena]|uniref:GAF domain-containing protein n=1 Tax=Catalinimonas alkaloidigena TaxID=1075417 RepID=UPI002404E2D3|nr:GAF domain-containing protein [Catalinimonas alkaloidigena]MDF9797984.1 L-methionine (R)-S-oxide reductase [Catalinimonas alkaloidigena]
MAEDFKIVSEASKEQKYQALLPQIKALTEGETNLIANLSNITAALKQTFNFWWIGFYLVEKNELVLGPFQGPVACTRIQYGKGVCGTAYQEKKTVLVADVDQFPGHIACSADSRSEIVVPVIKDGEVLMVLDIDSSFLNDFDSTDQKYLEQLAEVISSIA